MIPAFRLQNQVPCFGKQKKMKQALIFGSTGLIGNEVLQILLQDSAYHISTFTRKAAQSSNKVTNHVINFNRPEESARLITGDVLFCCLGTTIRKAGSRAAFREIDYELVLKIARIAVRNGVARMLVISSVGADANSGNFYLKTKGEMERDLQLLPFQHIKILRPSILTGKRKEFRLGEKVAIGFATLLAPLMMGNLSKYRPIKAETVARAMIALASDDSLQIVYESDALQLAGK